MSYEPLKKKLLDRNGQQVAESVQSTVTRAFERALSFPDANIDRLITAAAQVARVLTEGGAMRPEGYAFAALGRAAWHSQREFDLGWRLNVSSASDTLVLSSAEGNASELDADILISQLLSQLDERDRMILTMRSRGFLYSEIAEELGITPVTVRVRYCMARNQLLRASSRKR